MPSLLSVVISCHLLAAATWMSKGRSSLETLVAVTIFFASICLGVLVGLLIVVWIVETREQRHRSPSPLGRMMQPV